MRYLFLPMTGSSTGPRGFNELHVKHGWPWTVGQALRWMRAVPRAYDGVLIHMPHGTGGGAYRFDEASLLGQDDRTKHLAADWELYVGGVLTLAHYIETQTGDPADVAIYTGRPEHGPFPTTNFKAWVNTCLRHEMDLMKRLGRPVTIIGDAWAVGGVATLATADQCEARGFKVWCECAPQTDTGDAFTRQTRGVCGFYDELVKQFDWPTIHKPASIKGPITALCRSAAEESEAASRGWHTAIEPWTGDAA